MNKYNGDYIRQSSGQVKRRKACADQIFRTELFECPSAPRQDQTSTVTLAVTEKLRALNEDPKQIQIGSITRVSKRGGGSGMVCGPNE